LHGFEIMMNETDDYTRQSQTMVYRP